MIWPHSLKKSENETALFVYCMAYIKMLFTKLLKYKPKKNIIIIHKWLQYDFQAIWPINTILGSVKKSFCSPR